MLALFIIIFGFCSRLIVHTPNFTPVLSLALFGGVYLKGRQAIWVPLVLMMASDLVLGFHDTMIYTWGSIVAISLLGVWIRQYRRWGNILAASVVASFIFFVVTNFGAFLSLYPQTVKGLQECYILAIPFYRSMLVSTLAYSLVLFAIGEWVIAPKGLVPSRLHS